MMLKEDVRTNKEKYANVASRLSENDKLLQKKLVKKIERFWLKRKEYLKQKENEKILEEWRNEVFEIEEPTDLNIGGRPKKRLCDGVSSRTENNFLDELLDKMEVTATHEGIEPYLLLDKLNKRAQKRWKSEDFDAIPEVPVEDACALIYNVNFSLRQYQQMRNYLSDFSISLPVRNDIDTFKKGLMCDYFVEATKTFCHFDVLVIDTLQSLINLNKTSLIKKNDEIHLESKFGIDGSGSHQIRHQVVDDESDDEDENDEKSESNYIGAFWCPLSVTMNGKVIWTNELPNSTLFCRPLCLIREKETRASVLEHFKPYIDSAHLFEEQNKVLINDTEVNLSVHTELSMIDGKMVDIIQGDSGSFCHYCKATRKDANDLTCIMQGFHIEKTFEEMKATWDNIESGEMLYNDPDRAGQCHEPMNVSDLKFFAILHQKLRSLDMCLKLLYHLVSGQTHTWSETSPNVKLAVGAAKKEVIDHIRKKCGFLVDCPTKIGGNTNTGPIADRFFDPKNRELICSVIRKSSDREGFVKLLSYFNMILSITQQSDASKIAKPESIKELGYALMIHMKKSFPFAMISPSVHQMCAHAWELFEITHGKPIALYAEQSGEAWNKHIRAYKSGADARARQCSIRLNTCDIFTRMLVQSHPLIASKKKLLKCSVCKKPGHTIRSCPTRYSSVLNEEKSYIESCYE